jgi:branched-chain amino acid transport system permease protein
VREFLAFTIVGIVTGSVYAVAASGLVVTYTTSGIFNFAHGAMGMFMAFTYWELRVHHGWPALPALIVVLAGFAPLLGGVVERVLMRGLEGASVGTSLVVTVGLLVGLMGAAQAIWPPEARQLRGFFDPDGFRLAGVFVTWHQVITILAAAAVAGGLWLLLFRTRTGVSMRAVVDDRNLVALTGARPARISQLSWALGASLAALAGILLAPVLQLNILVLTLLVVNAYAAAMFGRLRNLPLTFFGAVVLGLAEAYSVGYLPLRGSLQGLRASLPTLFLFGILLLLPQSRVRPRGRVGASPPLVPSLRRSLVGAAALVFVAFVVSGVLGPADVQRVGQGLVLGIIMLSLVPLTGLGGQVSLCQMTFAGLGAYAMAHAGADGSPAGLIAAVALAAVFGAVVAIPALRLQGLYLALGTMAFAVLMDAWVFPDRRIFGTLGTLNVSRLRLPGVSFEGERAYFMLLAIVFCLMGVGVLALRRGMFGRLLAAMRDSPAASVTLGMNLASTKLAVFTLSAAMAGLGGALYGGLRSTAGTIDFQMFQSLPILLMAVIGGITTVSGALTGGMFLALLPVLQERVPALGGLVFIATGLGAVSLGRNPDGLAALGASGLRRASERYRARRARDATKELRVGAPAA